MFAGRIPVENRGREAVEMVRQEARRRTVSAEDATARRRLGRALRRLRAPWVLLQALLVAACGATIALWLEIPDRSIVEITLSFSVAIAGVMATLWIESYILTLVRRRGGERVAPWKGALLLTGLGLVYWLVATIFDVGEMRDVRRAAAWSLEPRVSAVLSVDTLMMMQGALWWMLRFVLMTALLPFAMEGVATGMRGRWVRRAGWILLEPLFWSVVLGSAVIAMLVTEGMLTLRPHVPVLVEILLTVLKVIVIFAVDVGALCFALSLTGTFLRDAQLLMPGVPAERPSSGQRRRR